jgi:TRAP-type uncharacterized transport system substrate-binding protein
VIARDDLEDEVVTLLLDVLEQELDRLTQVNDIARQIDLSSLKDSPVPLHPATARWLEARGIEVADAR